MQIKLNSSIVVDEMSRTRGRLNKSRWRQQNKEDNNDRDASCILV